MRRFPHYLVALVVVAATSFTAVPHAGAQSASDKVKQAYEQYDGTTKELEATKNQVADLRNKRQQLDNALASLTSQVSAANGRIAAAEAEAARIAGIAAAIQAQVDETVRQLDQAEADMKHSALLLYTQHGANTSGMLSLLNATEGSGSFVEGNHYLRRVSDKRRHDATRVKHLRNELETRQVEVAQQQQAAEDARITATNEREALETLIANQQRSRAAVAANEEQTNALVGKLNSDLASEGAALAAAEAAIRSNLANSGNGGSGPSSFIRSVSGPVTSQFGYRTDPISGGTAFHAGVDFGAACGTPIKAAASGKVFQVTPEAASGGYGNMTILTHGGGLATVYGHQSSIVVSPGAFVSIGDVIGYVGSTGKSTGCHLHFEVRLNGTAVDPTPYL